jgi:hypothetical protein
MPVTYETTEYAIDDATVVVSTYPDPDGEFPTCVGRLLSHPLAHTALASVFFVWRGGGYIDFGTAKHTGEYVGPDDVDVVDCFNVFDYEFDGLLIERTPAGFADFLATFDRDDIDRTLECVANG